MRINNLNNVAFEFECQEKESSFVQEGKDAYCTKCRERIFDLRHLNQREIADFVSRSGDSVCAQILVRPNTPSKTRKGMAGFSLFTLLAVGIPVTASTQMPDVVQTTSLEVPNPVYEKPAPVEHSSLDMSEEASITYLGKRLTTEPLPKHRLRIGRAYYFINGTFPWVHRYRIVRGRFKRW